jgi:hypothetical protein
LNCHSLSLQNPEAVITFLHDDRIRTTNPG